MNTARDPQFVRDLEKAFPGSVHVAAPLNRYSTYRIGGPATMVSPRSPELVGQLVRMARDAQVPIFPLGFGSNLLFPDEGMTALILRIGKGIDQIRQEGATWWLGAGTPGPIVARKTATAGWGGVHMLVGVPGTVGGGVYMNAGCHGGDWASVVQYVTVIEPNGEDRVLARSEIPFAYRASGLGERIVVEVTVDLEEHPAAVLEDRVRELFAWRQAGTPFQSACCGSVFRNPDHHGIAGEERSAGQLLDAAGLKGTSRGAAQISELHANYFVNRGGASARDILLLMREARARVRERFGVLLQPEVKILLPDGSVAGLDS